MLIKRLFSSPSLYAMRVVSSEYLRLFIVISSGSLDSSLCFIQPIILHDVLCIEFCQENTLVIVNTLFSNTREDSTYGHHQRVNTEIRLIIFFASRDGEALDSQQKQDCGSDHELLIAKFRLKLKKVGKTTRPFRYELKQIPSDYTVQVRNRFKGLDLIDCLKNYGQRSVTLYRR